MTRVATINNHGLGWKPDLPDHRDLKVAMPAKAVATLPDKVDLRETGNLPSVYAQLSIGSCVGNACAGAFAYVQKKESGADFDPSRLFIYYGARDLENSTADDAGAQIRDGAKCCAQTGVASETDWPYDIAKFADKPPTKAYTDAGNYQVLKYASVSQNADQMKAVIAAGYPIVVGFTVYDSFESDPVTNSGVVPLPRRGEKVLGGHAVCVVGYDTPNDVWIVRNSWSSSWGMQGYFTMPTAYLTNSNLSSDFWTFTTVETGDVVIVTPPDPTPTPSPSPDASFLVTATADLGTATAYAAFLRGADHHKMTAQQWAAHLVVSHYDK